MTQTSKQTQPSNIIDTHGRVLMGKQSPVISRRERIRQKIDLDLLAEILDEQDQEFLSRCFANRSVRKKMFQEAKIMQLSEKDYVQDQQREKDLNRLIQRCRDPRGQTCVTEFVQLYKTAMPWWKVKADIVFRLAQFLTEEI